jgi:hypothetical protein
MKSRYLLTEIPKELSNESQEFVILLDFLSNKAV